MKIRNGFVSNSSSSSFVVLLPQNFDVEKIVNEKPLDKYYRDDLFDHFEYDGEDNQESKDAFVKQKTIDIINEFIENGEVYNYDTYAEYNTIQQVLSDYIIADIEAGSGDGGSGVLANREQIEKILKN